ncbi:MAG: 50S ribosomal protein L6 [Thermoplasmata archaeon]|nr:MAG: 50S ribosomal protein L6 [Thermoplasmata archaeon]RLF36781.1 MAG: 50S ribosomal protein L6 [Thermoplasmata archaeon]
MPKIADIKEEIVIPDGVEVSIDSGSITVKGEKGSLSKTLFHPMINIIVKNNVVEINCKSPHRREKALVGTFTAHIKNMIKGVTEGFEYRMKTVFSHFPIKTTVEGNEFVIHNFLGERSPRKARILDGVKVEIKGDEITLWGIDKEKVGQTAANIERATKVKNRDIRVFQDGIYLVSKEKMMK